MGCIKKYYNFINTLFIGIPAQSKVRALLACPPTKPGDAVEATIDNCILHIRKTNFFSFFISQVKCNRIFYLIYK